MKTMKNTVTLGLWVASFIIALSAGYVSAQALHVDSVSVDSVWSSDSSWTDGDGNAQNRSSRDCKLSFVPQGAGKAAISVSMSIDSGRTFVPATYMPSDTVRILGFTLSYPLVTGTKAQAKVRVLGGNRPGVVFKVTANQKAPVIDGNPPTIVLGPTGAPAAGTAIQQIFKIRLANDTANNGYSTVTSAIWDTVGNGTFGDTTKGASAFSFTWSMKAPAGASGQTKNVIVRAIDANGVTSDPETLGVQFGLRRPIVMKAIPAGTFQMGEASIANGIAEPVHPVTLSAFSMQETPVTQEQYLAVMGTNPSFSIGDLQRPVEKVSWFDAVLFCNALSKLSNLDTCYTYASPDLSDATCNFTKKGYRLPTEAEWEFACRGGTSTTYWWGNDSNGLGAGVYTPQWNSTSTTQAVARLSPNQYGLYDIDGNGWKWCNDYYSLTYYASSPAANPKGPDTGFNRVLRGGISLGSFFVLEDYYRSAFRANLNPDNSNSFLGFGCAMTK